MNTFLPEHQFWRAAVRLDKRRLIKQRLEALDCLYVVLTLNQLKGRCTFEEPLSHFFPASYEYNGNLVIKHGRNHACVKQWMENPYTLTRYLHCISLECNTRNVADNAHIHLCSAKLFDALNFRRDRELNRTNWWENPYFIHQHRAALLQKDFAHYSEFYPHITAAPTSDYFWWDPTREKFYRIVKATRKTPHHYVYYDFLPVGDSSA